MDTVAMKYFMEIASGHTYWNVAENHHISQSSVSKAIIKLEAELGVDLFDRSKRTVTLTPAGQTFHTALLHLEPEFTNAIELVRHSSEDQISLCIVPHISFLDINMRIRTSLFSESYPPQAPLSLSRSIDPIQAIIDLNNGEIDFVIGHLFRKVASSCDYVPLQDDTLFAILPLHHPLAQRETLDFMEIYKEPIRIRSLVIKQVIQEICELNGVPLPPNLFVYNWPYSDVRREQMLSQVAYGQGITLYFESDLYPYNMNNLRLIPVINCPDFPVVLYMRNAQALTQYQKNFVDYIRRVIFHI